MKILFLCNSLTCGGAERVCASISNGLSQRGHEVIIFTDTSLPITYDITSHIKLYNSHVSPQYNRFKILKYSILLRRLSSLLRKEKPDVVISIMSSWIALLVRLLTKTLYKCPMIKTEHNSFERPESSPMSKYDYFCKFYENYLYDYITVLTNADYQIIKNRFPHSCVMPNPCFLNPIKSINKQRNKRIIAVGRLDAWYCKGFDLLIKAWNDLAPEFSDWSLSIIGGVSDESKGYLRSLSTTDQFSIIDYTSNIVEEYQKSEIFVLSSRYEGFGLVLIEAMSQGCACIACDYKTRQKDIIQDGVTGLICETENVTDLKRKIKRLIEDTALRASIQQRAPESTLIFSEEKISEKWDKLLKDIVSP